jgi:chromate transporter
MKRGDRSEEQPERANPPLSVFVREWAKVGCLSFGGPAGQIALMHREIVDRLRWVDEAQYLRALNFCMLLPGPEAQQLAAWCGWRMRGTAGGLIAGLLFVLPGAAVMAALTALYIGFGRQPLVQALFYGIQAVVLAIVAQALARVAGRALAGKGAVAVAVAAFVALFFFDTPFPLVVLAAGIAGSLAFAKPTDAPLSSEAPVGGARTLRTALLWLAIWAAPVLLAAAVLGPDDRLTQIGAFFARMAAVTFGGAYAALTYVAQAAVDDYGWLTAREMLDGLGLAETTPGPLVLVLQFVGGLAGWRDGGLGGAALAMAMTLWVTFAPSFLWIFALAPHIERLSARPRLAGALAGITAAVVGVIANLALWFALNLLFHGVEPQRAGPLRLWVPNGAFDWTAGALAVAAWLLLTRAKLGMAPVLALGAAAGVARYAWTAVPI